jgi:pimeloyl-ACP methyl ester carboxylesterase
MDEYQELAQAIIDKQGTILGMDMALDRARRVSGLVIDGSGHITAVPENSLEMLKSLIGSYEQLLGPIGITFAKDAIKDVVQHNPDLVLPELLR